MAVKDAVITQTKGKYISFVILQWQNHIILLDTDALFV